MATYYQITQSLGQAQFVERCKWALENVARTILLDAGALPKHKKWAKTYTSYGPQGLERFLWLLMANSATLQATVQPDFSNTVADVDLLAIISGYVLNGYI